MTAAKVRVMGTAGAVAPGADGWAGAGRYVHECDRGFCTVCGSVWPCPRTERVRRGTLPASVVSRPCAA